MIRKDFPKLGEHYFEERLPNGLLVRVMEKPGFAKRYAFVAADYGSIDAEFFLNGKKYTTPQGVAHYLEHKMFDLPEGNAMQEFAKYAGANNAFTSYTMTAYYVECTEHLEENFEILLRMVTTGYFTEESVQKERGIIAQEIKMYEDSADSAVMENLFRIMYQNHPVRNNIAGTVESIEEITADTLKLCHDAFYDPSNLIVCVIGDVDAASIIEQARRLTPAGKKPQFARYYGAPEPEQVQTRTIEKQMEIAMPAFAIGFRCPDAGRGADAMRMDLIGELAGEMLVGESSKLYQKLYDENVIDADFSVDYERMKGMALLELSGDSEDPRRILREVLAEAARVLETGVDRALLARLKKSVTGRRLRELDGFEGTCYRMCAYYFDGAEYFDYPEIYASVTAEDVEQFIRENVKEEQAFLSVITPKREEE